MIPIVSIALALSAGLPAQQASEIAPLIERLGADDPGQRLTTERALGRALLDSERGVGAIGWRSLEGPLRRAPAEARRRVARVLGADDRMFGIAADLFASSTGAAQSVGREALEAQLSRWSASAFDEPDVAVFDPNRQRSDLPRLWTERLSLELELDPLEGGALLAFDRLDRLAGGPVPIVVDPRVATSAVRRPRGRPRAGPARTDGTWAEVLEALCGIHGAAYQLQGFRFDADTGDDPGHPPPRPWIHVVPRGTTELAPAGRDLRTSGAEHVIGWCGDVVREGDIVRQIAAARALAILDWPAALTWLETRWLATGDVPALEGLLAAAARGRVALSLQRPDVVRTVLSIVDEDAREVVALRARRTAAIASQDIADAEAALLAAAVPADRRARRFGIGLAGLAPVALGVEESVLDVLFERFDGAPPTGRWVRLVAAEGMGVEHGAATQNALRVLRGQLQARSRRQALRTLLRTRGADDQMIEIRDPSPLFVEIGLDTRGLGLELGLAGVKTNNTRFVDLVKDDLSTIAEILAWGTHARDEPAPPWLVPAVRAALEGERASERVRAQGPFDMVIRRSRGDARSTLGRLAALVGPKLRPVEREQLDRQLLRTGAGSSAAERAALETANKVLERAGADVSGRAVEGSWLDLAALAGSRDEEMSRTALGALGIALSTELEGRGAATGATSTILVDAAENAIRGLRRMRRDTAAEAFLQRLRKAATRGDHPMARRFYRDDWPPPPELAARDLMLLEPPLPPR